MSTKELIVSEIEKAPESVLNEVLDFLCYLKKKEIQEDMETLIVSESSLAKDWLKLEEDKAWQNL